MPIRHLPHTRFGRSRKKGVSPTPPPAPSYVLDGQGNQLLGGDGLPILDGDN